jgi:hypothetical protein
MSAAAHLLACLYMLPHLAPCTLSSSFVDLLSPPTGKHVLVFVVCCTVLQGDRGSVIDSSNSVRVKFVCPPSDQSIQAARAFSAPEGFPANEVYIMDGVCVLKNRSNKQQLLERKCYDDAIHFSEFTLQVGNSCLQPACKRSRAQSAW